MADRKRTTEWPENAPRGLFNLIGRTGQSFGTLYIPQPRIAGMCMTHREYVEELTRRLNTSAYPAYF